MNRVLLLNADWSPLNFVSGFRALNLIFKGRAEVISMSERPSLWNERVSSPSRSFEMPATLRLLERVNRKYTAPRFRKWVLFNRDNWQCQYCGIKLDQKTITIDHVMPRSRGGPTNWKNCVASCKRCNWKKGSRTPSEIGMQLRKNPTDPSVLHFWEYNPHHTWHPDWTAFFGSDTYQS
jgi:hypothetical protein